MATDTATVLMNVACPPAVARATVLMDVACPPAVARATVTIDVACPPEECPCDTPYVPTPPPVPSEWGCVEETERWRVRLTEPHVLHQRSNQDARCLTLRVERVVNCARECGIEEFTYCWPQGCPVSLLPPGTYDIYVPAQSVFPLETGIEVELTIVLEPVGDDYVAALSTITSGSKGCC